MFYWQRFRSGITFGEKVISNWTIFLAWFKSQEVRLESHVSLTSDMSSRKKIYGILLLNLSTFIIDLVQNLPICQFDFLIDLFHFLLHLCRDSGCLWDELNHVARLA